MGRRVLAFFLGLILGIVLVVGGVAGAIYITVCVVKVDQMVPDSGNYLGDLAGLSLKGIYDEIFKLYGENIGVADANGNYYSLRQFCENYKIDLNAALGMELPQEVMDIPAFEFFSEGGIERAMKQIKVSTLPAIANLFGGANGDGTNNGMFGDSVIAELANFSMYDLLVDESVGIAGVFANVRFAELLPDSFPAEDSDNKIMWAVGQTKIGGLLDGMSGSESIMLQLKQGGAFETLGGLELSTVLGESQYVNAIMGSGAIFADLIADDGTLRFDDIISGVSVGELLGCQKNEITDLEGYIAIDNQGADAEIAVMSKGEGENTVYIMSANGEDWFEAELKCENTEEAHTHNHDCYKYVWYSTTECAKEHDHRANGDMIKDGINYARTDGLYQVLAALSITDLTGGNTDALIDELKVIKIRDIIDVADVDGVMDVFVDLTIEELMNGAIDDMYLGEFFGFTRVAIQNINDYNAATDAIYKERDQNVLAYYVKTLGTDIAMSLNLKDWYVGEKSCDSADDGHIHNENCYNYVWNNGDGLHAEGVQNKLASKQIADLQYLNDDVQKMTLHDVFGENIPSMLKAIADVQIGNLSVSIDKIELGELLGYERRYACGNTDESHEHSDECGHVWYKVQCDNSEADHEHNGSCYVEVGGMMAKLADKQVGEMSSLSETIKTFTLRDVLGTDVPDMLKVLADTEIGDLNTAIKTVRLGDFLEYEKRYVCDNDEADHTHGDECAYAWYKLQCKNADADHTHNGGCYVEVVGMMAKLADKTVNDLGDMNNIVQDFTLFDVLGDNIPPMLKDVANVKVKDINTAVQDIYLGSALGYARKEINDIALVTSYDLLSHVGETPIVRGSVAEKVYFMSEDGKSWYEADRKLKDGNATYTYVWYETDESGNITEPVSGIVTAFVNSKVGGVNNTLQTITLGEMGIGGDNRVLSALQDTPIKELGGAINNLEMAIVLGYKKQYTCGSIISSSHPSHASCPYIWVNDNGEQAKGLNAKIADKTVKDLTGDTLTQIALDLTIGDLIDSGMIELGEEEKYKLNILFCQDHDTFNGTITIQGMSINKTFKCTMPDYLTYSASNNTNAKEYYYKFASHQAQDNACERTWMDLRLKDFVKELLEALS